MKIELNDVTNIDSVNTINSNFDRIVNELQDKVLYRDNPVGEPNTLENNLDMNGFDIINVKDVYSTAGRWATIDEMLSLNAQALTSKNQSLQYSLDSLQYSQDSMISAYESLTAFNLVQEQYKELQRFFLGGRFSEPVADNQGNSLQTGCMYLRLTEPTLMRVFNGSAWQDVGSITTTTANTVDPVLFASTLEAEQGTSTAKVMSPARVKDAIDNQVKSGFTSTGPIVLPGDATNALEAVPKQQLDAIIAMICPPGKLGEFATHPDITIDGWVRCNGQELNRTTDAALYAALGGASSPWGQGDGTTTFNVPDYRGRSLRDLDEGAGRDAGRAWGSYQDDQNKAHSHTGALPQGVIWLNNYRTYGGGWPGELSPGAFNDRFTGSSGGSEVRVKNATTRIFIKR